jgi:hypothetical protein
MLGLLEVVPVPPLFPLEVVGVGALYGVFVLVLTVPPEELKEVPGGKGPCRVELVGVEEGEEGVEGFTYPPGNTPPTFLSTEV